MSTSYNNREAQSLVRRLGLDEVGVAVSYGWTSMALAWLIGTFEFIIFDIPVIGWLALTLTFGRRRLVLVTDRHTRVYRATGIDTPAGLLAEYPVGPGQIARRGATLTFPDGLSVKRNPLFRGRPKKVEQAVLHGGAAVS